MASTLPPAPHSSSSLSWSGPDRQTWRHPDAGNPSRNTGGGNRGRSGGRGGRGGRGGSGRGGAPSNNATKVPEDAPQSQADQQKGKPASDVPKIVEPPTPAVAGSTAAAAATNKASGRPKQPRKASDNKSARKPGPTLEPSATLTPNLPPTAPRVSTGRRKRSQAKNLPTLNTKSSLSSDSSSLTVQSAPSKRTTTSKDLPPHLMTPSDVHTFDIKSDIEALVDRMRSVAMDRPHTPGSHSHFDWASDDDDSLPDLPDWGTTNAKEDAKTDVKASIISPILEDALRPLPNIEPGSPFTVPITDPVSPHTASPAKPQPQIVEEIQETREVQKPDVNAPMAQAHNTPKAQDASNDKPQKERNKPEVPKGAPQPAALPAAAESASQPELTAQRASSEKVANKLPVHPSLPPKPTVTLEAAPAKRHARQDTAPGHKRGKLSATEADRKAETGLAESMHAPKSATGPVHALKSGVAESMHAPKSGLFESMHAPKSAAGPDAKEKEQSPEDEAPLEGLAASMHAPSRPSQSESQSAPSHISSHPIPDAPPHLRSRGPLRGHRQPYSASVTSFSHPDLDRARADNAHHARTQSSPPAGAGAGHAQSRSVHSRPVITGDALSRLARTLGAPAPRRETAVPVPAAAKD
ncbi:hypothetical protein FOMPIDRAFT_1022670 [Fomitopsis schrenkii]|uniref:Uncharacterized protein n=1 Tax=Fomitopsis schrenkii TaxID=2126942 RepID=S8FNA1_FOMSC|nr:hypothetical protein FOMPIDRAFT_1022670 [Fomitopsis schrenkii]